MLIQGLTTYGTVINHKQLKMTLHDQKIPEPCFKLMDWSHVDYFWIIVMFLSAVWTLILMATHSLLRIHW